jgi:hypothetical protein
LSLRLRFAVVVIVVVSACAMSLTACRGCNERVADDRREGGGAPSLPPRVKPPRVPKPAATPASKPAKRATAGRTIFAETESATGLVIDDDAVYAIGSSGESRAADAVTRFPLDGSARSVLAANQPYSSGPLALDATDVYFVVRGVEAGVKAEVRRVSKRGGAVTTVLASDARIRALAVEPGPDGRVLAATGHGPILRATKDGARLPAEIGYEGTTSLTVDGDTVYGGAADRLWTRKVGAKAAPRALAPEACTWMTVDATYVYCARPRGRVLEIVRLAKTAARVEPVCTITLDATAHGEPRTLEVEGLAVDDQRVYASATHVTQADTTGLPVLFACPKSGGAPAVIVKPLSVSELPIAVVRGELFWSQLDSMTSTRIMRSKQPMPDALDLLRCFRDDATGRKLVTSDIASDLDPTTAIAFLAEQNELCGDTYCEGDYDFFFHDVRCSASGRSCQVSMRLYGDDKTSSADAGSVDVRDGHVRGRVVGYASERSCRPACMEVGDFSPCSVIDVVCEIDTTPPFEIMMSGTKDDLSANVGRCIRAVESALDARTKK